MKFLKILLLILVILAGIFFVGNLFIPKEYHVERSVEIEANYDLVKKQTFGLEAMYAWSPWAKRDTNQVVTFTGVEGSVGQVYAWEGDKKTVGKGSQEIVAVGENKIEMRLTFIEPWDDQSDVYIELEKLENGTVKVTWALDGKMPYPMNFITLTMDGRLGADFEEGLGNLKALCEKLQSETPATPSFAIQEIEAESRNFLIYRQVVKFDQMQAFYANHFTAVSAYAKQNALEFAGMPSGIYFEWDQENMQADMAAGIPLAGEFEEVPEGYEKKTIGGKALLIEYYGPYEGVGPAHEAMDVYMKENNLELNEVVMEEYITDPTTVSDPSQVLTKIFYFVK